MSFNKNLNDSIIKDKFFIHRYVSCETLKLHTNVKKVYILYFIGNVSHETFLGKALIKMPIKIQKNYSRDVSCETSNDIRTNSFTIIITKLKMQSIVLLS